MLKKWLSCICAAILLLGLGGCEDNSRKVKIGVSIGAGGAARWQKDMAFMQERAKALGADIERAAQSAGQLQDAGRRLP